MEWSARHLPYFGFFIFFVRCPNFDNWEASQSCDDDEASFPPSIASGSVFDELPAARIDRARALRSVERAVHFFGPK